MPLSWTNQLLAQVLDFEQSSLAARALLHLLTQRDAFLTLHVLLASTILICLAR
jgi:hypothetical protein